MKSTQPAWDETVGAEGERLNAYLDGKGIPTIGRGSIVMPDDITPVKMGDTITLAQEIALWNKQVVERDVQCTALTGLLPQNKFNACWCFIFNEGSGQFKNSTLHKKLIADMNDVTIPTEFMKWIYAEVSGKPTIEGGLVIRRGKEISMWNDEPLGAVANRWDLLKYWLMKENIKF